MFFTEQDIYQFVKSQLSELGYLDEIGSPDYDTVIEDLADTYNCSLSDVEEEDIQDEIRRREQAIDSAVNDWDIREICRIANKCKTPEEAADKAYQLFLDPPSNNMIGENYTMKFRLNEEAFADEYDDSYDWREDPNANQSLVKAANKFDDAILRQKEHDLLTHTGKYSRIANHKNSHKNVDISIDHDIAELTDEELLQLCIDNCDVMDVPQELVDQVTESGCQNVAYQVKLLDKLMDAAKSGNYNDVDLSIDEYNKELDDEELLEVFQDVAMDSDVPENLIQQAANAKCNNDASKVLNLWKLIDEYYA